MSEILDHVAYLSKDIGPRPAGTEEEQGSALYITETLQKEAGLSAVIEDFNCIVDTETAKAICALLTFLAAGFAIFFPVFEFPALAITIITCIIYLAECLNKPILSRLFGGGVSQNIVAKYEPAYSPEGGNTRRRKVVLVAHYDSGKVRPDLIKPLLPIAPYLYLAKLVSMVAVPFLLLLHLIFWPHVENGGILGVDILIGIFAVIAVLQVINAAVYRLSSYNEGANCNASGVSVLMEVAERVTLGHTATAADAARARERATMHGEEALRNAGLIPEGAELVYEDHNIKDPDFPPESAESRLLAAKAAIAAMTGKPVSNTVNIDLSHNLVQLKEKPIMAPSEQEMKEVREDTLEAFAPVENVAAFAEQIQEDSSSAVYNDSVKQEALYERPAEKPFKKSAAARSAAKTVMIMKNEDPVEHETSEASEEAVVETAVAEESIVSTDEGSEKDEVVEAIELEAEPVAQAASEKPSVSPNVTVMSVPLERSGYESSYSYQRKGEVPSWFKSAREKARKTSTPVAPIQRSRYAEALEAAEREGRESRYREAFARNAEIMSETERRLQEMRDSIMGRGTSKDDGSQNAEVLEPDVTDSSAESVESEAVDLEALGATITFGPIDVFQEIEGATPPEAVEKAVDEVCEAIPETVVEPIETAEAVETVETVSEPVIEPRAESASKVQRRKRAITLPETFASDTEFAPLDELQKQRAPLAESREDTSGRRDGMRTSLPTITGSISRAGDGESASAVGEGANNTAMLRNALPSLSGAFAAQASGNIPAQGTATIFNISEAAVLDESASIPSALNTPQVKSASIPISSVEETSNVNVSVAGSFAAMGATGAFAPIGDELVEDVAPEDIYVEDVDDSDYADKITETGAYAGPGYVEMPHSRASRFFGKFRRGHKKKEEESTPQKWLDVDDDFDAREVGAARGSWESFNTELNEKEGSSGESGHPVRRKPAKADGDTELINLGDGLQEVVHEEEENFSPAYKNNENDPFVSDDDFGDSAFRGRYIERGRRKKRRWNGGLFSRSRREEAMESDASEDEYAFEENATQVITGSDIPSSADESFDRYDITAYDDYDPSVDYSDWGEYAYDPDADYAQADAVEETVVIEGSKAADESSSLGLGSDVVLNGDIDASSSSAGLSKSGSLSLASMASPSALDSSVHDEMDAEEIYGFRNAINTEIIFVALGSELAGNAGMRVFLDEHAEDLKGSFIVQIDAMGAGDLTLVHHEGMKHSVKVGSRMMRYVRKAATSLGMSVGQSKLRWIDTASSVAAAAGYQTMHLVGMKGGLPAYFGRKDDVFENIDEEKLQQNADFIMELLKKI